MCVTRAKKILYVMALMSSTLNQVMSLPAATTMPVPSETKTLAIIE